MRIAFVWLAFCCLSATLFSSCRMFGAGSHVYCETVTVACPSDTVIQRITMLKSSGRFNDVRSFQDGLAGEQWVLHNFSFYDSEHQFIVVLEVPLHTPTDTEIHLARIEYFASGTQWIGFADLSVERKKVVRVWFDRVVRPALAYKPLSNAQGRF